MIDKLIQLLLIEDLVTLLRFIANRLMILEQPNASRKIYEICEDYSINQELTLDEIDYIKESKVILAIRSVRQRTGLGLREAKDLVDICIARRQAEKV